MGVWRVVGGSASRGRDSHPVWPLAADSQAVVRTTLRSIYKFAGEAVATSNMYFSVYCHFSGRCISQGT